MIYLTAKAVITEFPVNL